MSVYSADSLEYFKKSVESIFNQTYSNVYLFVWRDGPVSVDIDLYLQEIKNNTRCIVNLCSKNNGLAYSLNSMINLIIDDGRFDYIARMDSDDISYPNRIAKQVDFLEKNIDIDVLGTNCREFGARFALDKKTLPQHHNDLIDFSITRCPFIHPTVIFRSKVFFDRTIRYPINTVLTEDMALWFLLLTNRFKFANLNEVLLDYRLNESTLSRRHGWSKSLSEVKIRLYYMHKLKRYTFKNFFSILLRLIFHIMPIFLVRLAYRYAR